MVLRKRFWNSGKKRSYLEEVGKLLHVTRERIRQIEAKALRKLRHPIRSQPCGPTMKIRNPGTHPRFGWSVSFCCSFFIGGSHCYAQDSVQTRIIYPDGIVVHCFDGDTVKLMDRRIIRLAGIDAPELGKQGRKPQFYARKAKEDFNTTCARGKSKIDYPGDCIPG